MEFKSPTTRRSLLPQPSPSLRPSQERWAESFPFQVESHGSATSQRNRQSGAGLVLCQMTLVRKLASKVPIQATDKRGKDFSATTNCVWRVMSISFPELCQIIHPKIFANASPTASGSPWAIPGARRVPVFSRIKPRNNPPVVVKIAQPQERDANPISGS